MKLRVEVSDGITQDEVIIRCGRVDETVQKLQQFVQSLSTPALVCSKGTDQYYLPPEDILFFETQSEQVYAHTKSDVFTVKHRLYELEDRLPGQFLRVAKGTIVNTKHIHAIQNQLASANRISFSGTHKHIFVTRHYYKALKEKMNDRSF